MRARWHRKRRAEVTPLFARADASKRVGRDPFSNAVTVSCSACSTRVQDEDRFCRMCGAEFVLTLIDPAMLESLA